jgi:positive phototaxis protein PixI
MPSPAPADIRQPYSRLQALLPQLFSPLDLSGEAFLQLQMDSQGTRVALPLEDIEETKTLSLEQITPMPNLPPHMLGLMASKGQVFWAVSLPLLWQIPTESNRRQDCEVVVVRTAGASAGGSATDQRPLTSEPAALSESFVGLVVPKILSTLRVPAVQIRPMRAAISMAQTRPPCPIDQLQSIIAQPGGELWVIDLPQLCLALALT